MTTLEKAVKLSAMIVHAHWLLALTVDHVEVESDTTKQSLKDSFPSLLLPQKLNKPNQFLSAYSSLAKTLT